MKRKFLELRKYLREESTNPRGDILWILWSILNIPMIVIHEFCHLVAIYFTATKAKIDPKKWYFLTRQEISYINNEGKPDTRMGLGWAFPVALIECHPLQALIVGGAPVIGVLFDIFLCFYIPLHLLHGHPLLGCILLQFMLTWMGISLRHAWLSEDDINCVKLGWKWIKEKYFSKTSEIKK